MATSTTSHRPIKGILKNKGSTDSSKATSAQQSGGPSEVQTKKSNRWDESNIRATCRSAYRDYDSMKINEPNIPHLRFQDGRENTMRDLETKDQTGDTAIDTLAKKLAATDLSEPNCLMGETESKEAYNTRIFLDRREKQRQFELRRKLHYTEGLHMKLGRELIAKELQCEEMDDENEESPPVINEEMTAAGESDDGPVNDEL
ncbi:protein phosphatase inhibitor 2 family member C [Pteronotus mesoamericanus]|uniref:protein phosphatase inhibitor 2 family member C n=1 Tax=Pteronotus mesoamericanus TaxID=1884717 RepID=UPI0023EC6655|nr:protein phosphatase inhibitor 2 family member C [Pteronotus parnellii mesoamericanus]